MNDRWMENATSSGGDAGRRTSSGNAGLEVGYERLLRGEKIRIRGRRAIEMRRNFEGNETRSRSGAVLPAWRRSVRRGIGVR
jgi:hypothetical protein